MMRVNIKINHFKTKLHKIAKLKAFEYLKEIF